MTFRRMGAILTIALLLLGIACTKDRREVSVKQQVDQQLKQAGMDDINVDEDRDKRLVTLKGNVRDDAAKTRAAEVAQSAAPGWAVANELAVLPAGDEGDAKEIAGNLDDAIEKTFKATLVANRIDDAGIDFHSKNGVLTLEGKVDTSAQREQAQKLAATVPNVNQVVNKIEVKHAKGTAARP